MTRWVTVLVVANVAVHLLGMLQPEMGRRVIELLAYAPVLILERPWTIVTYMFVHGGWGHLFFNMLGLFFFGPRLEMFLGENRFLVLYFLSGIAGALLSSVFSPNTWIIGASGGVFGVFMAFAYFWPKEQIYIWGIFPVEARWMVLGMTVLALFWGFGATSDGIAHFAHLGGFLGAFLYLRWLTGKMNQPAKEKTVSRISQSDLQRWLGIDPATLHEVNREELERIQTKLKSGGEITLTESEKAFLERFSQ